MPAIAHTRKRHAGPVVLAMVGPADGTVRTCLFCNQPFAFGQTWVKVGYPTVAWVGAHDVCSAAKDKELSGRVRP